MRSDKKSSSKKVRARKPPALSNACALTATRYPNAADTKVVAVAKFLNACSGRTTQAQPTAVPLSTSLTVHFGLSEQQLKAALALVEWEVLVNLRQERASEFAAAAWEPLFDWAAQDAAIKRRDDRLRVLFLSPRGGDVEGAAAPAAAPVADKADAKTGQSELKQADTSSQAPKPSRFVASDDALEELNNRCVGCVEAFAPGNAHMFTSRVQAAANIPNVSRLQFI